MKFSGLFTLALATVAIATPAKRADSAADIIDNISAQVDKFDDAVSAYKGGDPSKTLEASDELIKVIKSSVEQVNSGPDLSNSDALALTSPVQDLTKKVEGVVDKVISAKSEVVKAGAGGDVKQALNDQYDAASSLAEALSSKVPESLSDIAEELSSGITDAIQKGVDAYKDVSDSDGGDSTSSSSSAEPTETSTGSSTETATDEPTPTSSTPVIPTGGSEPTGSSTPTGSPTGSATPPEFTGAASKQSFSLVGGALAAVAVAVAV